MDGITQLGINLPALITQVISFVILLLVLTKLLYKPLLKILDERSEKVKNSLTMADEARKEAEKARAEMQEEIERRTRASLALCWLADPNDEPEEDSDFQH